MSEQVFGTGFSQLQQSKILLQWLGTIDGLSNYQNLNLVKIPKYDEQDIIETLQDGISILEALCIMDENLFNRQKISYDEDFSYQAYHNYQIVLSGLRQFYEELHGFDFNKMSSQGRQSYEKDTLVFNTLNILSRKLQTMKNDIEQTSIRSINQAAFVNIETLMMILELSLGVAVNCENTEQIIGSFTEKLNEAVLDDLMQITQDVLKKYGKQEQEEEENEYSEQINTNDNRHSNEHNVNYLGAAVLSSSININNQDNSKGLMDFSKRQNEKVLNDETILDLNNSQQYWNKNQDGQNKIQKKKNQNDDNDEYEFQNKSQNRQKNKSGLAGEQSPHSGGRWNKNNRSQHDISNNDYFDKIDEIEEQNQKCLQEIERLKLEKEAEIQKTLFFQKETQNYQNRIEELERANQKNENLLNEKHRQLNYDIQMKEQQIEVLHDQIRQKQIEFRDQLHKYEEELDVERENGVKLQKLQMQNDQFRKAIAGLQEGMEQFQEQKIELQNKNDQIKQMQKEVAVVDELQSVVKLLREDLVKERQKSTELELQIHDAQNNFEDCQRQLTIIKKREDMLKQNIQELNFELEKLRENDANHSFFSNNSIQQTMLQELEMKIQSLQSQNDTLRSGNQEIINAKYIELENKVYEAERINKTLQTQYEQEKLKNKKLINDLDQMVETIKEGESDKKNINENGFQAMHIKNQKLEIKIKELENFKNENKDLKLLREKTQQEIKQLFEEKQKLFEDIMALKDQVSQSRSETKEKILIIGYHEQEKSRLLEQSDEQKKHIQKIEQEFQALQIQNRQIEQKLQLSEHQIQTLKNQIAEEKDTYIQYQKEQQIHNKHLQEAIALAEKKASEIPILELKIERLQNDLNLSKQHEQQLQTQLKQKIIDDNLNHEKSILKQQKELMDQNQMQVIQQYQQDIINYKIKLHDMESAQRQKEKELNQKIGDIERKSDRMFQQQKEIYEQKIQKLQNSVISLQNELSMECHNMSAQEEMMHSLIHTISFEFSQFAQLHKDINQSSTNSQSLNRNRKIDINSNTSFLDHKIKSVYENN